MKCLFKCLEVELVLELSLFQCAVQYMKHTGLFVTSIIKSHLNFIRLSDFDTKVILQKL